MENFRTAKRNSALINPETLIRIDFSPIYFNIDANGFRSRKPFDELVEILSANKKVTIIRYLKSVEHCGAIMGRQVDEKTGGEIPGPYLIFTDGKFAWTSKTIYHFENYDMKLPEEFVKHILEQEKTSGIKENYG